MTAAGIVALLMIGGIPQSPSTRPSPPANTVTLDGCVAASSNARNAFTLDDDGQTYLLKGVSVRDFVGKHVEVVGITPKRLRIVGGLYPSPNIAAQPDNPTKGAIASQSGPTSQSGKPAIE